MENDVARTLVENLLERIERDEVSGKWRLQGVISEKERQALVKGFELLGGIRPHQASAEDTSLAQAATATESTGQVVHQIKLDTTSLDLDGPEDEEVILCLDFGTAMSKAFATRKSDMQLLDLAVGQRAGQEAPPYEVYSSVYIAPSGQIYFGSDALAASLEGKTAGLRRFDSPKDILCKGVVTDLDDALLESEFNPTNVPLTKGDLVTLYLAFLTDMAVSELHENFDSSRYVRRRFTRPVLPAERAAWAEDELTRLLARAQVLADTLHGRWSDGIDVRTAKKLLTEINGLEQLPTYLVGQGVIEPIAAIASRFRDYIPDKNAKRLIMVMDVGAGTIDFAMFAEIQEAHTGIRYSVIPSSIQVLRQAGDTVDRLLKLFILEREGIPPSDPDFKRLDAGLSFDIRRLKEQLFREGRAAYRLENDATGVVGLDEFLSGDRIAAFGKAIHSKFMEVLGAVPVSWYKGLSRGKLPIIFTGGGGGLPMVQSVAEDSVVVHGRELRCQAGERIPRWIREEYPLLIDEYPQLAVAVGGCSRDLPELAPQTFEEFGGLDAEGWEIRPAYKGEDKM